MNAKFPTPEQNFLTFKFNLLVPHVITVIRQIFKVTTWYKSECLRLKNFDYK